MGTWFGPCAAALHGAIWISTLHCTDALYVYSRTPTFSFNWETGMQELWLSLVKDGENSYVVDRLVREGIQKCPWDTVQKIWVCKKAGLVMGTWRCSHLKTARSYSMRTEDSAVWSLSQVLYWFINSWANRYKRAFISVFINWCDFSLGFCCCSGQGDKTLKEVNMPQCFVDVRKASRKAWSEII